VPEIDDLKFYNDFEGQDFWKDLSADIVLIGEIEKLKKRQVENPSDEEINNDLKKKKRLLFLLRCYRRRENAINVAI